MSECICNTCKNLKSIVDDSGAVESYECEYGFPSELCTECEGNKCDVQCEKYISDEEEITIKVNCKKCGKELEQKCGDSIEGEIYCVNCYLGL